MRVKEQSGRQRELIEAILAQTEKRCELMARRFAEPTRRIDRFIFWSLGLTVSVCMLIVATSKLWPPTAAMTGKLPRRELSGACGQPA